MSALWPCSAPHAFGSQLVKSVIQPLKQLGLANHQGGAVSGSGKHVAPRCASSNNGRYDLNCTQKIILSVQLAPARSSAILLVQLYHLQSVGSCTEAEARAFHVFRDPSDLDIPSTKAAEFQDVTPGRGSGGCSAALQRKLCSRTSCHNHALHCAEIFRMGQSSGTRAVSF